PFVDWSSNRGCVPAPAGILEKSLLELGQRSDEECTGLVDEQPFRRAVQAPGQKYRKYKAATVRLALLRNHGRHSSRPPDKSKSGRDKAEHPKPNLLLQQELKEKCDLLSKLEEELDQRDDAGGLEGLDRITSLPVNRRTQQQREELRVTKEALSSLRQCFRLDDPYQHTLDTIEQSLCTLLERVTSMERQAAGGPAGRDGGRRLNFDSTGDPRRLPITTLEEFPVQRLDPLQSLGRAQASTKVIYYTEKSVTPFLSVIPRRLGDITLRDFKVAFDRPGLYRFHFKTLDPEFGMVKEEDSELVHKILNDDRLGSAKLNGIYAVLLGLVLYTVLPLIQLGGFSGIPLGVGEYIFRERVAKLLSSIYPHFALCWVLRITGMENDYSGKAGWNVIAKRALGIDNVTIIEIWAVTALSSMVLVYLIWYLSRVLPRVASIPQHPLFPFMHFGQQKALDGVDIEVYENQVTLLLGHNGAGKTTLMSILT
ncbi:hypothetical protein HPB47_019858, partial [Ixodes persulcatus]